MLFSSKSPIFVIQKYFHDIYFRRYYRSFVFSCVKCSPCCQDTKEDDIEPQCLRQGFPSNQACRYTGRDCGGPEPTLKNIVFKTTATQDLKESRFPLPYFIGCTVLVFVVLVLLLVTTFLAYRVYFDGRRSKRIELFQLKGKWLN